MIQCEIPLAMVIVVGSNCQRSGRSTGRLVSYAVQVRRGERGSPLFTYIENMSVSSIIEAKIHWTSIYHR